MNPLYGLVLAGGQSRRMGQDKAAMQLNGQSLLERSYGLLEKCCQRVFVAVRESANSGLRAEYPQIVDHFGNLGPADGIASAQRQFADVSWLVVACDLPLLNASSLQYLIEQHDSSYQVSAYRSSYNDLPEPLCAIYTPSSAVQIAAFLNDGIRCPRKMLLNMNTQLLSQPHKQSLDNANTPEDWAGIVSQVA